MSKVFEWKAGSLQDKVSGNFLTNNGVVFKQTEKGMAGYSNSSNSLIVTNELRSKLVNSFSFSINVSFKALENSQLFTYSSYTQFMINKQNYSGTDYFQVYMNGGRKLYFIFPVITSKFYNLIVNFIDNSKIEFYINGILYRSQSFEYTDILYASPDEFILNYNNTTLSTTIFNHALTTQEINNEYKEFLSSQALALSKSKFINYPDYNDGDVTFFDDFRYEPADGTDRIPTDWIKGTGTFKFSELTSDIPSLGLNKGHKMLECVSGGTVVFQSEQAYGTWELIYYFYAVTSGAVSQHYVGLISEDKEANNSVGLSFYSTSSGFPVPVLKKWVRIVEYNLGSSVGVSTSIEIVGYEYIKVEKLADTITLFVNNNSVTYTLVNTLTSIYTIPKMGDNDKITNIKYTKGIVV